MSCGLQCRDYCRYCEWGMSLSKIDFNNSLPAPPAGFLNVSWSSDNSSHLAARIPIGLTTGMAYDRGSDFVQATAVFAGTNASGSIGSGGISVSVLPPIGGGLTNIKVSAGTLSDN